MTDLVDAPPRGFPHPKKLPVLEPDLILAESAICP